ncbi:MAG: zinc-dependent metalloprotease [Deltaproteobacteria bacterium]|nr:zinc-dependent metalloprotease [Deltaproteobacteria bacterium]
MSERRLSLLGGIVVVCFAMLSVGCSKDKPAGRPQILSQPVKQVIRPLEMPANGESSPRMVSTSMEAVIDPSFLEKDLMLGGLVTALDVYPEMNVGGLVGSFFPTQLVRLSFDEENDRVRIKRSPLAPWNKNPQPSYFQREIGSFKIKSITSDGKLMVDLGNFAANLYASYGRADLTGMVQAAQFRKQVPLVIYTPDHISFPIETSFYIDGATVSALFRFYLKKWVSAPAQFKERRVRKDFGFFTRNEMFGEWISYPAIEELTPEDVILRWNLAELTEPIVYVISKEVPEMYREDIKRGIEAWNVPLKQMLGKSTDVILAKMEDPQNPVIPGDLDTNYIFWETNPKLGQLGMHASWQNDPMTGEIFHGDVNAGGQALVDVLALGYQKNYASQSNQKSAELSFSLAGMSIQSLCNMEAEGYSDLSILEVKLSKEEYVKTWIRNGLIHEVGHNFGLRHNFKGSLTADVQKGESYASVMDYASADFLLFGLEQGAPGRYDVQALTWAEKGEVPAEQDLSPFCTDEQTDPMDFFYDPYCRRYDFGSEPVLSALAPNLHLNAKRALAEKDLLRFNFYFSKMFHAYRGMLEFLTDQATAEVKHIVNTQIAGLMDMAQKEFSTHPKVPEMMAMVLQVYFDQVFMKQQQDVLTSELVEALATIVLDIESPAQLSVESKLTLIDRLADFRKQHSQSDRFMAYHALTRMRNGLEEKLKVLQNTTVSDEAGAAQLVYKQRELLNLKTFLDDRLNFFLGERKKIE